MIVYFLYSTTLLFCLLTLALWSSLLHFPTFERVTVCDVFVVVKIAL